MRKSKSGGRGHFEFVIMSNVFITLIISLVCLGEEKIIASSKVTCAEHDVNRSLLQVGTFLLANRHQAYSELEFAEKKQGTLPLETF